ncbi:hypothetical protein K469DRAFT_561453 [Zopfia rhizophila CBS 207.26]|uniref:Zn(2)-C6 fungal-type domain-containing protein n=1 Tax=Zopfia rhizophila CBS 207.26 TaxID=1314779 RepID=A0A6A6EK17_9PEZI|nr:hypothetical protein K469DRAFT_561453 [Zopfia rhizophila CBS 207.26]
MTQKTAAFVSKRPHKKSRGGCITCKCKRVKCDESHPRCGYCMLRNFDCVYAHGQTRYTPQLSSGDQFPLNGSATPQHEDFNTPPLLTPNSLVPAASSSIGVLTKMDQQLLHHYRTYTWKSMTVRDEEIVNNINRELLPRIGISHCYLLWGLLSITASHVNQLNPSAQAQNLAIMYRQKTLTSYTKALQNITTENYESLLITSMFMQILVEAPKHPCSDEEIFNWLNGWLSMSQGLRILASLKWSSGFEKLSVFPVFSQEVTPLPPAPNFTAPSEKCTPSLPSDDGQELPIRSQTPNPAPSGTRPSLQNPNPAFLPPPLLALLGSIVDPPSAHPSAPLDLHPPILLPVLHAMSPLFLSFYHFYLSPDFYVRIVVYPTSLTPEYLNLVRNKEPRALVILSWWFALVRLVPNLWWMKGTIARVLQAVRNRLVRSGGGDGLLMKALEGASRVVRLVEARGREVGAKSVFEGWEGVDWDAEKANVVENAFPSVIRNKV